MEVNRVKYVSIESAWPQQQAAFMSEVITHIPASPNGDLADELRYAADFYDIMLKLPEYTVLSTSILGAMINTMISNPMFAMMLYETIGSVTNTMYPDGVIFITYTERDLKRMGNQDYEFVLENQNSMRDSLIHFEQKYIELNYHADDLDESVTKFINECYGWKK